MKAAEWGDGTVEQLAEYIARTQPGLRGFTRARALADPAHFIKRYPIFLNTVSPPRRQVATL